MSKPRKHHYIPQSHIRNFRKDTGYRVVDLKTMEEHNPKSSSEIFAVRDLNTFINEHSLEKDYDTIEDELNSRWDSNFTPNFEELNELVNNSLEYNAFIEIPDKLKTFFFEYAIMLKLRSIKVNKEHDEQIFTNLTDLTDISFLEDLDLPPHLEDGKKLLSDFITKIGDYLTPMEQLKFKSPTPTEARMLVPKNIGFCAFIAKASSFCLPDSGSYMEKSTEVFHHNHLILNKIKYILIPLSNKICIYLFDQELCDDKEGVKVVEKEMVLTINDYLRKAAFQRIIEC